MYERNDIPESDPYFSEDEVIKAFGSAEQQAAQAQKQHSKAAQDAGYTREVIQATTGFYVELARLSEDDPRFRPIVASGIKFMNSIANEFHHRNEQTTATVLGLAQTAASASVFCDTSGTLSPVLGSHIQLPTFETPPSFLVKNSEVEEKLYKIDPALLNTYREIGQVYHGTTADPSRAALSMMRQAFDHLFDKLAPNDRVIGSAYWKPKPPAEPTQVTRKERMTYAAHTHINDPVRANTLIASIDNILATYKLLNNLHRRGGLSEQQARRALSAMKKFIETWAEAIEL
jgi:hypothetical protein